MNDRPGQIACPMPIGSIRMCKTYEASNFSSAHILPCKKKKTLNPQVFSRAGKIIKKFQRIPNTLMNTNLLERFDNVYVSDGVKTALSTHGGVIKALQTSMMVL